MQFEDRFSKYLFRSLFDAYSLVEVGSDLLPNTFYADVLLIPEVELPLSIPGAELFARLTGASRCLVEAYSDSVTAAELRTSLAKMRLALQRADTDGRGVKPPRGVLWVTAPYWSRPALSEVLHAPCHEVEPGLLCWQGNETVYFVNTTKLALREDTIMLRLLGNGKARLECVLEIFRNSMEPYVTVLNNFDLGFKKMAVTEQIHEIDPRLLKDLRELRDTREEALRALGWEKGREEGLRVAVGTLAQELFPQVKEKDLKLLEQLDEAGLRQMMSEMLKLPDARSFRKHLLQKVPSTKP